MEAVQRLPGAGQVKGKALLTHFKSNNELYHAIIHVILHAGINQIASASVEVSHAVHIIIILSFTCT
jgi:excinuclease UvrABC nuclease subunit